MKKLILLTLIMACNLAGIAQPGTSFYQVDSKKSSMKVEGTSNLHDWEVNTKTLDGRAQIILTDKSLEVSSLYFSTPAASLKSDKKGMDSKTHQALKADKHPKISFQYIETISCTWHNTHYELKAKGLLTIAGKTRELVLPVIAVATDKAVAFEGYTTINMTDFGVTPPTALFGTITTGNKINILFNVTYTK